MWPPKMVSVLRLGSAVPVTPPKMPIAARPPPRRPTEAGRLLDELNVKTPREGDDPPQAKGPDGRGARLGRPSQI